MNSNEDMYMAGSPGMGSVGAIGGNTNRGRILSSDFHRESIERIKQNLKKEHTHKIPPGLKGKIPDKPKESTELSKLPYPQMQEEMYNIEDPTWLKDRITRGFKTPQNNKLFRNTPPAGLAQKVKRFMASKTSK